jgi:hypothetical protein
MSLTATVIRLGLCGAHNPFRRDGFGLGSPDDLSPSGAEAELAGVEA